MDTVLDAGSLRLFIRRRKRFRSYFKKAKHTLVQKVPKGRGGKYETNLCNNHASYYVRKRYANSYICKDEQ